MRRERGRDDGTDGALLHDRSQRFLSSETIQVDSLVVVSATTGQIWIARVYSSVSSKYIEGLVSRVPVSASQIPHWKVCWPKRCRCREATAAVGRGQTRLFSEHSKGTNANLVSTYTFWLAACSSTCELQIGLGQGRLGDLQA